MDFGPKLFLVVVAVMALVWFGPKASAQTSPFSLEAFGSRWGFSTGSHTRDFNQAEGFMVWSLPMMWDPFTKWHLSSAMDLSAGWLGGGGDDAFISTAGPLLHVRRDSIPLTFDLGSGLTLLSREKFGPRDLGSIVQFSSYASLNYDFGKHLRLSYRFQHMSNGNLGNYNPGLNLHMIGVSYRF